MEEWGGGEISRAVWGLAVWDGCSTFPAECPHTSSSHPALGDHV